MHSCNSLCVKRSESKLSFWIVLIILLFVYLVAFFLFRRNLPTKSRTIIYKHVNRLHSVLELTVVVVSLIALFFIAFVYKLDIHPHYIALVLSFLLSIRFLMELKYTKLTKQHVITGITALFFMLIFTIAEIYYY